MVEKNWRIDFNRITKIVLLLCIVQVVTYIESFIPFFGPTPAFAESAANFWDGFLDGENYTTEFTFQKDNVLGATVYMPYEYIGDLSLFYDGWYQTWAPPNYDIKMLGPFETYTETPVSVQIPEGTYVVTFLSTDSWGEESFPDTYIYWDEITMTVDPCFPLESRAKNGKVGLTWENQSDMERYDIYRSPESSPSDFVKIGETISTYSTYTDYTVENETTYLYAIGLIRTDGDTCFSAVSSTHPTAVRTRGTVNYNPVIYSVPITIAGVMIDYIYDVNATDPNGDTLTYELITSPEDMTIDENGLIFWMPTETGTYDVTVTVTDINDGTCTQSFEIEVENPHPDPEVEISYRVEDWDGPYFILDWQSKYALSCTIEPDIGDVGPNGSHNLGYIGAWENERTYTITVTGYQGTSSKTITVIPPPSLISSIDNSNISPGESVTLTWESTHATMCTIEPDIGEVDTSGSLTLYPTASTTYYISVTGPSGTANVSHSVVIYPPTIEAWASPRDIPPGDSSVLSWSTDNADTVTIEPDIGTVDLSGSITVNPSETTTYSITASGDGGSTTKSVTINILPPEAALTISSENITFGESVTLSWNTENATSCTLTPDIGEVESSGSLTVSPTETTTYTITASGVGEDATATATVTVYIPPPEITFTADPETIDLGDSSTLSWNITNATSCTITPDIGEVELSGSLTVSPTEATTYTITVSGLGQNITATATVTINISPPEITFTADPETIDLGESSTLSWNTSSATSCTITPDIGEVELSGSLTVSPTETTTYTITASGVGEDATAAVTVTVYIPPPEITFTADPETIDLGDSSTLSWNITNATSCTITPDIGEVELNGSTVVSPTQSTTYTLTATGPGGTSTAVVRAKLLPGVQLSADPSNVRIGLSTTLSWASTNADSCVIEPGSIVCDTADGTVAVTPTETTTYTITAENENGSKTASTTVEVYNPFTIEILSPEQGEEISRGDVMVRGTFANADNLETGIVVNGEVAIISGNQFIANHVDLESGENTISVVVTDISGATITETIDVTVVSTDNFITVSPVFESKLDPLETTVTVFDGLTVDFSITESEISYTGPGTMEILESSAEEYSIRLTGAGVYFITASVVGPDMEGNDVTYTDTVAVEVIDPSVIDASLKAKWEDMKAALATADIDAGLQFFTEHSRERYGDAFEALTDILPQMVSEMQEIEQVYCENGTAKYTIIKPYLIDGVSTDVTHFIYFTIDDDGIWRIDQF